MSLKDCFDTVMSILVHFVSKQENKSLKKTVSCMLNKEKLVAWIPCHKPLISKKNQKVHLDFATYRVDRGTMEYGSL